MQVFYPNLDNSAKIDSYKGVKYDHRTLLVINDKNKKLSFTYKLEQNDFTLQDVVNKINKKLNGEATLTNRLGEKFTSQQLADPYTNSRLSYPIHIQKVKEKVSVQIANLENPLVIMVDLEEDTVGDLKAKVEQETGIKYSDMNLGLGYKNFEKDDLTLKECKVEPGAIIKQTAKFRGATTFSCVNIDNEQGAEEYKIVNNAPRYRTYYKPGLILEALCKNKNCEAYQKYVIITKGMGSFDIFIERYNNKCQICNEKLAKVEKIGFIDAYYSFSGLVVDEEEGTFSKKVSQNWIGVGHYYKVFSEQKAGTSNWKDLTIHVKPNPQKKDKEKTCGICRKEITKDQKVKIKPECSHEFHEICILDTESSFSGCSFCSYC